MDNISFLKQVLTSGKEYWVAARREYVNRYGTMEREPDSVWLICIPYKICTNYKMDDLLVKDVEELHRTELHNIPLSVNWPPFQYGITMRDFHTGFPLDGDFREFLIKALQCGNNILDDYQKIWAECNCKPELQTLQPAVV